MSGRLDGKVVLVTGGSRGIGRAIASSLAIEGATVVLAARDAGRLSEAVEGITSAGGRAESVSIDVADRSSVKAATARVLETHGRIDGLVNNAGVTRDNLVLRMKDEDWQAVLATNLTGVFLCTQAVLRPMIKQRSGRIVNVTSVVGLMGNAGQANYAASKAGVVGFTKSVAREVASRGITVNAVAPGFIETDMTEAVRNAAGDQIKKKIPVRRLGRPEDVANAVLFLVADEASYITGQVLRVDGGLTLGGL